MFTGIVEHRGALINIERSSDDARFSIVGGPIIEGLSIGASVAVNGTCLTVVSIDRERGVFDVELVSETLARTSLADVAAPSDLNLERAMSAGGRFDGHVVQGHVDGVGIVSSVEPEGDGKRIAIDLPRNLLRYVVEKGSITLDGVSLTVAALIPTGLEIALIPHTLSVTNIGAWGPGTKVNVEVDILAKYVERLMEMRL
jgi:riboflavin synthase